MSAAFYLLVRLDKREKLLSVAQALDQFSQIIRWDAVDGYYGLVIKATGNPRELSRHLEKLYGVTELSVCELTQDNETTTDGDDERFRSYVFLETDRGKREQIRRFLGESDNVAFCSPCLGKFDGVAVVHGETFDEVDRFLNEQVRPLDGVLRLKQDRIIHLDRI
ncbi:MAG: Lrp/AsnC ligand binding domain-containing protein [candidate division Zixibacteria bacterium]|nr:Lrp/AsnC ligand binding domain-containing protein [candidate division Zixibacteria bacterium]